VERAGKEASRRSRNTLTSPRMKLSEDEHGGAVLQQDECETGRITEPIKSVSFKLSGTEHKGGAKRRRRKKACRRTLVLELRSNSGEPRSLRGRSERRGMVVLKTSWGRRSSGGDRVSREYCVGRALECAFNTRLADAGEKDDLVKVGELR